MLAYKTRNNTTAQGKPRVYFCAHEDDFRLLESVAADLLKSQNCAVFYRTKGEENGITDIGQMQLFVMPVTKKLLTTPNAAMDSEYPFAVKRHIPVLPIMMEEGLVGEFTEKFGDLQFLDKFQNDPTAIPYEEKLDKYLKSVLIGDELAEKIRGAFDAYIFLSYRKKDRQYAQELMKNIHKNEFCRDIAIWYDEYLVPGEDFNDAIRKALEKSELFSLVVTPNLIVEENYVQKYEFPMAREAGKRMIPAEMVETDRTELARQYEGILDPVDGRSEDLTKALLEACKGIALTENDGDDEHNFFIALAYLGGVDVEVDYDRAKNLLTACAEKEYLPAIEKLVDMYRTGLGVARSYLTAVGWQKKLVGILRKRFFKKATEETYEEYASALFTLVTFLQELWDYDEMEKAAQELLVAAWKYSGGKPSGQVLHDMSSTLIELGIISMQRKDFAKAEKYYAQASQIDNLQLKTNSSLRQLRSVAVGFDNLGDVAFDRGELDKAEEYYLQGLEKFRMLAKGNGSRALEDVAICCQKLLEVCKARGERKKAIEYGLQAVKAAEKMANLYGERRMLAACYDHLGGAEMQAGNLAEAERYCLSGLKCFLEIAKEGTPQAYRDLSVCYQFLGQIALLRSAYDRAEGYYLKCLAITKKLLGTGAVKTVRDISAVYNSLGLIAERKGERKKAIGYYREDLKWSKEFAEKTGAPEAYDYLALAYLQLGKIERKKEYLQEACRLWEKLVRTCPGVRNFVTRLNMAREELEKLS